MIDVFMSVTIKGFSDLVFDILTYVGGPLILLMIVFKGIGFLQNMNVQAIVGLLIVGIFLILLTLGDTSMNLLKGTADSLLKYFQGE